MISRRGRGLWGLTRRNNNRMRAATPPVGRLIQKHHLQEAWSASAPPTSGPTTLAMPQVAPMRPPYFPRSSSEAGTWSGMVKAYSLRSSLLISEVIICTIWMIPPPPIPCTPRPTQKKAKHQYMSSSKNISNAQTASHAKFCAAPQSADPIRNTDIAKRSIGLRPTKSDILPYNGAKPTRHRVSYQVNQKHSVLKTIRTCTHWKS